MENAPPLTFELTKEFVTGMFLARNKYRSYAKYPMRINTRIIEPKIS